LLKLHHNAQLLRKVACDKLESATAALRFTIAKRPKLLLHQRKVKKSPDLMAMVSQ
jgi:hypothetical protein